MVYQYKKREGKNAARGRESLAQESSVVPFPLASGGGESQGDIDATMAQRMERFARNQIPEAEAEADRYAGLAEGARTPEEVKSKLGEAMGADFTDVRFHTSGSAEKAAEDIGARAYATGRDVYFGEGGFDPQIAAHELVHTAQQGVVQSSMPTASAPAGGVQMVPKFLKKIGSAIAKPFKAIGRFFGGGRQQNAAPQQPVAPAPVVQQPIAPAPVDHQANLDRIAQTNVPSRADEQGTTTFSEAQITGMKTGSGLRGDASTEATMAPTMTPLKDEFMDFFDQLDTSGFNYGDAMQDMQQKRFGDLANVKYNPATIGVTTKLLGMLGPHLDTPEMQAMLKTIRENEMSNTTDPTVTPEERYIKGFGSRGMLPVTAVTKAEGSKENPNAQKLQFLTQVLSNTAYLERMHTSQDWEDFPEELRPLMEAYAPIREKLMTAGKDEEPKPSTGTGGGGPEMTGEQFTETVKKMIAEAKQNGDANLVAFYKTMLPREEEEE